MKRGLLLLWGLALGFAAPALTLSSIEYQANFPLPRTELVSPSSLAPGMPFDPAVINAAIAEMAATLQAGGHPFVMIPFPELIPVAGSDSLLSLVFHIEEKLPSDSVELRFRGLRYFTEAKLREFLLLKPDQTVPLSALPALQQNILDLYNDRGYLFASVQVDSLALRDGLAAYLGIDEGKPMRLEKYYFQGNKYTRDRTLSKLSGLGQNAVITPAVLRTAEENILRKSYITSCIVEPVDPASILIKVEEGKMTYLEGVLGFTQRNGKTELTGLLHLQFLNLWGSDRALALNWRQSAVGNNLELAYHESGPGSFPLAADLALSRASQDSTWIRSAISADIYSYHARQKYGLELAATGVSPGTRRPMLVDKTASRSIGAFWRLDSRDALLNPSRGMQTGITYRFRNSDTGKRWSNALEFDHTQYFSLSRRWTLSPAVHLRSLDDRLAGDYALYRMGGFNSLRGYRQDEFTSWRLAWANFELRYLINPVARVFAFYDHGLLVMPDGSVKADILAPGLGIRINTRLGILSLEYGLGMRENGLADFGSGMIHAGLDASF